MGERKINVSIIFIWFKVESLFEITSSMHIPYSTYENISY
jgi:hypothetical protein